MFAHLLPLLALFFQIVGGMYELFILGPSMLKLAGIHSW